VISLKMVFFWSLSIGKRFKRKIIDIDSSWHLATLENEETELYHSDSSQEWVNFKFRNPDQQKIETNESTLADKKSVNCQRHNL
jgi:hypothetical protein